MAGKKKAKKKVKAKAVEKEVLVAAPDVEADPPPPEAISEEPTMKCVDKGHVVYLTKSEYDKKFN